MNEPRPISGRARGNLPFAPEGWRFIIPTLLLYLTAWWLGWSVVSGLLLLLLIFMLNFFRDPERTAPKGAGLFIAPADGKVIRAEMSESGHYRVDIFMNVFNVHVNRAPLSGRITAMKYIPGKFINASLDHAGEENERNRFEMESCDGVKIAFTQISGLVARRIVAYVDVGDEVDAGQRIGMIRFGSRVNCEIPASYALNVEVGADVSAGLTVLAQKKTEEGSDAD